MDNFSKVVRILPDVHIGLTNEQVSQRISQGLYNKESSLKTKSISKIFKDNIVTLFNIINIVLAVAVFCVGSYKNMLFMLIILLNIAIGIFQEIRAKITIDKLSIISSSKVKAIRGGEVNEIHINDIVLDDIIELSQGNQVPTDSVVVEGACDVNESLLTGESDAIYKSVGDKLMSGSYLVSGSCKIRADKVGDDNYASQLSNNAKYVKKVNSEIMGTLNKIIKIISFVIIPLGALLFWRQYSVEPNLTEAVVSTVAALVGMIPEGLILLTSTVLAVSVIRLSRHKVLVQELYCIETLARVDVLCLDKTGTITEGSMEVHDYINIGDTSKEDLKNILTALANASTDSNPTINAIKDKFNGNTEYNALNVIAFSSDKKWSGANFKDKGSYVIGAEEFILGSTSNITSGYIKELSDGYRVITVAHSPNDFKCRNLPNNLTPVGIVIIKDKIRKEAKATLEYFDAQGVDIKIISGDNVLTVSSVAKAAGLKNYDKYVDAATLKTYEDILAAAEKYSIFGRVTPSQKYDLIKALKEKGHTVAMTGDGVNDVLALKEADCSVAMASGSDAARNVSQLVLVDSNFASMPKVVAEGRRSINNIQRSASLFLVKTVYSSLLALIFLFLNAQYPFQPIQMTLVSAFTIGIPSFILALEPNKDRINGRFFTNVMSKAVPAGVTAAIGVVIVTIISSIFGISGVETSTIAVATTSFVGLMVLFKISLPFTPMRTALLILMTAGSIIGIVFFKWFFMFSPFDLHLILILLIPIVSVLIIFLLLSLLSDKIVIRHLSKNNLI